jgi:hypothetical protein
VGLYAPNICEIRDSAKGEKRKPKKISGDISKKKI